MRFGSGSPTLAGRSVPVSGESLPLQGEEQDLPFGCDEATVRNADHHRRQIPASPARSAPATTTTNIAARSPIWGMADSFGVRVRCRGAQAVAVRTIKPRRAGVTLERWPHVARRPPLEPKNWTNSPRLTDPFAPTPTVACYFPLRWPGTMGLPSCGSRVGARVGLRRSPALRPLYLPEVVR